jgi:PAS domain S-box-containing protein
MPEFEFLEKILGKIEKIDRPSLQKYLQELRNEALFFHRIIDSAAAGILVVTSDAKIAFISRAARTLLGISLSAPLKTRLFLRDVIKDRELRDFVGGHLNGETHVVAREVEVLHPRHLFFSVSMSPLQNERGDYEGSVVMMQDVSYVYEEDRETRRSKNIGSMNRLAAGIAHEIGNPLNSINIHLKLIQRDLETLAGPARDRIREMIDVIQGETQRLDSLVRNFLKAARWSSLRIKEANINGVVNEAVTLMNPEIREAGIKLQTLLDTGMPASLMDAQLMRQVFINIIKNAIQSMSQGGTITIRTERKDKIMMLVFRDQGAGIKDDDLPHIFEPYFTTKESGSGLGLMIVHNIIQEHGGRIEVRSKRGFGTTFTILLPLRRDKLQLPPSGGERTKPS